MRNHFFLCYFETTRRCNLRCRYCMSRSQDGRDRKELDTSECKSLVLDELAKTYRGHPVGDKADEELKRLKADKAFKEEQSAERGVKAIEDLFYKVKPKGDGDDHAKWVKRYGRYIKSLEGKFKSFEKKYANTKVYERVKKLVSELGIG